MTYRSGIFLIVVGLIFLLYFAMSIQAGDASLLSCAGAGICLLLGIMIAVRYRPGSLPAERFKTINKFRGSDTRDKQK